MLPELFVELSRVYFFRRRGEQPADPVAKLPKASWRKLQADVSALKFADDINSLMPGPDLNAV